MPDRLEVVTADRRLADPQHLLRGSVHDLQASGLVDDDHALDHAGENGRDAAPVALEFLDAVAEFVHRVVQRPRDNPEFIVAVVEARRREVALPVALRHPGDGAHALADAARQDTRDYDAAEQCQAERGERGGEDAGELRLDARQRQRDTHEGDGGMRGR